MSGNPNTRARTSNGAINEHCVDLPSESEGIGSALLRGGLQVGEEGCEDLFDTVDGLIEHPLPTATTTALAAALFVFVPVIPALIGTLHMMGSASRGIIRKQLKR